VERPCRASLRTRSEDVTCFLEESMDAALPRSIRYTGPNREASRSRDVRPQWPRHAPAGSLFFGSAQRGPDLVSPDFIDNTGVA